jgi:hypothetical protein
METRYVSRCGFCNRGIRRVYRAEVVLDNHRWFCTSQCRNAYVAGHKYVPWWHDALGWAGVVAIALGIVAMYSVVVHQTARGHPATAEHAEWFVSQTNQNGMSCCDMSDGHTLTDAEWRIVGTSYEVHIAGEWVRILPHQMAKGSPNPTGGAAVWYVMLNGKPHVYCFSVGVLY